MKHPDFTSLLKTISLTLLSAYAVNASAQICVPNVTPQSISIANFDFSVSGEAKDNLTELIWQRCVYGQSWNGENCVGSPIKLTWSEALITANNEGGDWRLPDIKELNTIIDRQCMTPPINLQIFPDNPASQENGLWSSTPYVTAGDEKTNAWYVDMGLGQSNYRSVDSLNFVRFVK